MNSSVQQAVPATMGRAPAERFRGRARSRLLRADLLTVAAWASMSLAVALWLSDGGAGGATVTSDAYLSSLQGALDAANL